MAKSDKLVEGAKKAGKAMRDVGTKAAQNAGALNGRVIDHAEANTRAAFEAMRTAANVKSLQELAQIQTEFVKEQGARSMTQVKEIGDLIAQFGRDAMGAMQGKKDEDAS